VGSGREVTGRRADDTTVPLSLGVSAFELFGEQQYAIFLQDISERKRYERVLQDAKEKAEEVARLKSTFLANMSHEIRTPLTTVIGYAGVLAEEASDKHREFAQFIRNSGERLMETLNSVLSMAQLEASGVEIQLDVLDVTDEASEIVSLFKPLADEKELMLEFQPPAHAETPLLARLDRGALSSILQNLIGNAIKFTENGSVTVRVTHDADEVHLHVADTGIGIDPDFVPHLFDEFMQESTGVRRSHEGSGLGLAITKRLVDLMNGRVAVESEKGVGTEFIVSFPRAEQPLRDDEQARPDAEPTSPPDQETAGRLLLVEDNPETASLMQELLYERYEVTAVADGEAALRQAQEQSFDMVLLDINLGGDPSGADVLRRLRAQPAYEDIPIAAVTAYALPGDRERFLDMGFDAYLDKPFAPEDLNALMQQMQAVAQSDIRPSRRARPRAMSQPSGDMAAPGDRP
jgi:signal transduction histidine kinase/CheY-like chemotaxis protein